MFVSARNHALLKANGHYYGTVVSMAVVKKCPLALWPGPRSSHRSLMAVPILAGKAPSQDPGHFLALVACSQGRRLDEQRVSGSHFPGLRLSDSSPPPTLSTSKPEQAYAQGDLNINATTSTRQPAAGTLLRPRPHGENYPFSFDAFQEYLRKDRLVAKTCRNAVVHIQGHCVALVLSTKK